MCPQAAQQAAPQRHLPLVERVQGPGPVLRVLVMRSLLPVLVTPRLLLMSLLRFQPLRQEKGHGQAEAESVLKKGERQENTV